MDNIAQIIFLVIILGIGAVIKRISEKSQEEERKKSPPRTTRAEDLPEATRRMIYGTPEVPMARPARPAVFEEDREGINDEGEEAPRGRAQKTPDVLVLLQQMAQQAQGAAPVSRTPAPVARPVPARPAGQPPMRRVPVEQAPLRPAAPQRQTPPPRQQPKQRPMPAQAVPPKAVVPPPAAKAAAPRRERKAAPLRAILRDLDDVRRGIVLAEVLGTPKGLL
ncbi:MAG: hypothetical protein HZB26_12720 [Candidatus Hydrogenedentes bacterium]|nr:hypothetical protein [Candidatus Hydrogenedentota bacterium]